MDPSSTDLRRDLTPILEAFPRERSYLLPALQRVQAELGSLPPWALLAVGEHVRVPKSDLYGVATHFPELRLDGRPTRLVRVCTGLSCRVLGADAVLAALAEPADGDLAVEESHCAFICGVAPVVEIDGVAHGGVTPEAALSLLEWVR
jgi:NADH:ubiquinone oxidoreductase subunit E